MGTHFLDDRPRTGDTDILKISSNIYTQADCIAVRSAFFRTNMKHIFIFAVCLIYAAASIAQTYKTDVLGGRYECRAVNQPEAYDGKVCCTIIRQKSQTESNKAIVYVHGYNDYFLQSALGDSANAHGFNFYAVDLRRYGRSLMEHQDAFFCKKLSEYYQDIDSTIAEALNQGNTSVVLMGHSTGGLITSLYMEEGSMRQKISALVLNSPFLDWNNGGLLEGVMIPCVSAVARVLPKMTVARSGVESQYAVSLLADKKGEWTYNTDWKMPNGHHKKAAWVHAIHHGHKKVQAGMHIQCPVLVMSSDTSVVETDTWNEAYRRADIVLNAEEIRLYGAGLGKKVTLQTIPGGKHDLLLSEQDARTLAYKSIFDWLVQNGL